MFRSNIRMGRQWDLCDFDHVVLLGGLYFWDYTELICCCCFFYNTLYFIQNGTKNTPCHMLGWIAWMSQGTGFPSKVAAECIPALCLKNGYGSFVCLYLPNWCKLLFKLNTVTLKVFQVWACWPNGAFLCRVWMCVSSRCSSFLQRQTRSAGYSLFPIDMRVCLNDCVSVSPVADWWPAQGS